MIESLIALLSALNSLTPLGIAALLGLVMLFQSRNKKAIAEVSDNHLSGLPEMAESLKRIESLLQTNLEHTVYIRARINGGGR